MPSSLLIRPRLAADQFGVTTRVTAGDAGWNQLNMEVRRLKKGELLEQKTDGNEAALVLLGGRCSVRSNHGSWQDVGRRKNVFDGMPYALYVPRRTDYALEVVSDSLEVAIAWTATDEDHPARLITPGDSHIEIRGGNNATRQINSIIPPGFACHHLVCVEVYTPGGNWSSYPPHKHDVHKVNAQGEVVEGDLEEIYFYQFKRREGYAFQRVYNDARSLDESVVAQHNDIVLVPEGYHPVCTAYGYDCYYLNFLAGSAQTLAATDDPSYAWTRETWDKKDPRLPMVEHKMEEMVAS